MPATNSLQPPLTPAERAIVKQFGDWTAFMRTYGLRPEDPNDAAEGHSIVKRMAKEQQREQGR